METKPKPLFWIVLLLVVGGLVWFAVQRMGLLETGGKPLLSSETSAGSLEISFYSSSAKKSWVNKMVERFNAEGHKAGGKVVTIKAYHVESGASLDQMKEGKIKPDIWSPGDESWLQLGASYWKNVKQKELYDSYQPLVNIPLVIAMWEPMARALGYPKPIGWRDIDRVATNPRGWAAYGHPEWGKFRWGHAHPDANSGFLAVISLVYAASGKTSGLAVQDLKNPGVVSFLRGIEGAVEHYGLSNTWIDDLMHVKGPSYLSCAVQYENTIIESNGKNQNRPFKLVAIYPREGNFWTQHPAAILKEEWVTPEKREASKMFIDFLLGREAQTAALELGMRPIMKDLELAAPFDEDHGVQPKVTMAKQFIVPGENVLKRVRDLWEEVKIPATVVMVLDRSGSMKGQPLDNAKTGAVEFIKHMKPRDQLKVVIFNEGITELSEMCQVRVCGEQTIGKVQGVFAEGGTALHSVVVQTFREMRELRKRGEKRRYSILVLTDGKDTSSSINKNDFLDSLPSGEDYDVPKVFTIAYGAEADKQLLGEISTRTNARLFNSNPEDILKTYTELSANF